MPTAEQLKDLQSKTLKEKIQISSARIIEWHERWNGQVYVSFSGGKDSVVLLHLVRRLYPDVLGVYMDTGLEYPELRETEQDILQYIKKYNLEYAPVYGDLVELEDGTLHFTKCQRTGCVFCGFGCQIEDNPNRFQRLAETHPKLYDYCINGGQYNEDGVWQPGNGGLGMGHVLDYIGVDYKPIKE